MKGLENYYKFGFVRNPWDWRVSFYFHNIRNDGDARNWFKIHPTFEHFVKATHNATFPLQLRFENIYRESNRYDIVFCFDGKLAIDYVGKYETLYKDLKKIFEINDIEMTGSIDDYFEENKNECKVINYSKHDHYGTYYTDELIDIVYEQEKSIIEKYGYKFERDVENNGKCC